MTVPMSMIQWISKTLPKDRKRRLALLILVGAILVAAISLAEPSIGIFTIAIACPTYIIWRFSRWFARQRKRRQEVGKGTALLICVSSLLLVVFIVLYLVGVSFGLLITGALDIVLDTAIGGAIEGFVIERTSGNIYIGGSLVVGGDELPIELINNSDATNTTYAELIAFILKDTTDTNSFVEEGPEAYVCTDFAEDVHNNAEAAGIRAAFVVVDFTYGEGHALNAFKTTDKGLVYIDCTRGVERIIWISELGEYLPRDGSLPSPNDSTTKPGEWDTVAYIEKGKEYGIVHISKAELLEYAFYVEYAEKWQDYQDRLYAYNIEMELYDQEIGREVYVEGSGKLEGIEAWKARLDHEGLALKELAEELGDYIYKPLGIVKDICIRW